MHDTYQISSGSAGVTDGCDFLGLWWNVLTRELFPKILDLVKVVDLDPDLSAHARSSLEEAFGAPATGTLSRSGSMLMTTFS